MLLTSKHTLHKINIFEWKYIMIKELEIYFVYDVEISKWPNFVRGFGKIFPPLFYHLFPQHVTNHPTNFHKVLPTIFDIYTKKMLQPMNHLTLENIQSAFFFFFLFSKKKVETIYKSINCKIANFCL